MPYCILCIGSKHKIIIIEFVRIMALDGEMAPLIKMAKSLFHPTSFNASN